MTSLADNVIHLFFDGLDVKTRYRSVQFEPTNSTNETTTGSAVSHVQRQPGLNDTKMSVKLAYDGADVNTYIQKLKPGRELLVEYGPEGAVGGKPRHLQKFIVVSAPHEKSIDKKAVEFDVSLEGADEPIADMYDGATF